MSSSELSIAAAFTPLDRLTPIELQQIANADPYMAGYASRAVGLPLDIRACHSWQCGWNDAAEDDREGFTLAPQPATVAPKTKFTNQPARQRKLLDGLDCLPRQEDLF